MKIITMKVLIIDDERLARKELIGLLKRYKNIEVVGEAKNAEEGIEEIHKKEPDLIFLDIQMPGKNGFEMLEELSFTPQVVFTTAYDEYALKAFEVNAFDYLLKPIEVERLEDTINNLQAGFENSSKPVESFTERLGLEDQIFVKDGERCWFVKLKDISSFESVGNYVQIYFEKNKPLILKSLNNLEERLDSRIFFRANRKHIINLEWVENIENWFNGGLRVSLKDGKQIEISRRQAAKFKDKMSL